MNRRAEVVGLHVKMNIEKTKLMTNGTETPIRIGENDIDYVTEFVHLGQLISFQDQQLKEIERRIQMRGRHFGNLRIT